MPYLRALSSFRDGVRKIAITKGETALNDILTLCDKLRDEDLVPLGVARKRFRSTIGVTDGKALVKIVDPVELMRAREEKGAQAAAKAAKKAAAVKAEKSKQLEKIGSWSEEGLPLTDGQGKELSKNQVKKTVKEWTLQKKLHEEYLEWERRNDLVGQ